MKHRPDLEPGGLHCLEAVLDNPHAFVAESDVGDRERVIIGCQDELAIQMLGSFDLVLVEVGTALVIEAEIETEILGLRQPHPIEPALVTTIVEATGWPQNNRETCGQRRSTVYAS